MQRNVNIIITSLMFYTACRCFCRDYNLNLRLEKGNQTRGAGWSPCHTGRPCGVPTLGAVCLAESPLPWPSICTAPVCVFVTQSCPTLRPHGLLARPLCPRNSLGQKTGEGCHSGRQGILQTLRIHSWVCNPRY